MVSCIFFLRVVYFIPIILKFQHFLVPFCIYAGRFDGHEKEKREEEEE